MGSCAIGGVTAIALQYADTTGCAAVVRPPLLHVHATCVLSARSTPKVGAKRRGQADGNPERIKYANVSSYGDKEAGCAAYSLQRATTVQTPRRANRTPKLHGT